MLKSDQNRKKNVHKAKHDTTYESYKQRTSVTLLLFDKSAHLYPFLDFVYKQYHICLSVSNLNFTQYDNSRSIHVAAKSIISFFFMAE